MVIYSGKIIVTSDDDGINASGDRRTLVRGLASITMNGMNDCSVIQLVTQLVTLSHKACAAG